LDHEPEFRQTIETLKHDGIIRFFGLSINRWEPENGIKAIGPAWSTHYK